jgi:hypothetical protein
MDSSDFQILDQYRTVSGTTTKGPNGTRFLAGISTPGISDDEFKMRVVLALEEIAKQLKTAPKKSRRTKP